MGSPCFRRLREYAGGGALAQYAHGHIRMRGAHGAPTVADSHYPRDLQHVRQTARNWGEATYKAAPIAALRDCA
jgi:truncated hemoglobin YjbI